MKILYVTTISNTLNAFLIPHIKMLLDEGHQVSVACSIQQPLNIFFEKHDIPIYEIPFDRSPISNNNRLAYKRFKNLVKKENFDIIHTHTPVASMIVRMACRKAKSKVFYTAHGFHFFKGAPLKNWLVYYPIEYILSFWTDELITINKEDEIRAKSLHAKHVSYLPGVGVDIEKINHIEVNKSEKRRQLGLKDSDIVLLSVGELNDNKNHRVVLDAISSSNLRDNENIKYVICGEGPNREKLLQLAKKYGLENQTVLLGYRKDVYEIMKICDIFIFPSKREGLPVSVIEAMACQLPVITSEIRGSIDLIDEEGGYLFNPMDGMELSNNIKKMLDNYEKRKQFGYYNYSKSTQYSWNIVQKCMNKIYNRVV